MNVLSISILCGFLVATAATPVRPPDGTYSYRTAVSGVTYQQSTVTIDSNQDAVSIHETTSIPSANFSAVTTSRFDPSTLLQLSYEADTNSSGEQQQTIGDFSPGQVTLHAGSQSVPVKADPSASTEILTDNFIGTMVMVPALLEHTQAPAVTLAVTRGGRALVAKVNRDVSSSRPAQVPTSDRSVELAFGGLSEIYWYDGRTYVVHDIEIPTQHARIILVSQSPIITPIGSPSPVVTPIPTPLLHFVSNDVGFRSSDGTYLSGTVTIPTGRGPFPAIVLVAGSGPEDRDEAVGPNKVFLQLAYALSNAGFAVLRYDKRGVGKSSGVVGTRAALISDVHAAFAFLRQRKQVDPKRVFLLGHSEGGELVPAVAASDPRVAGIILLAAPAIPLWKISLQQTLAMTPPAQRAQVRSEELKALAEARADKQGGPKVAWYRSEMDIDPLEAVRQVRAPILILQGGSDLQILASDAPKLLRAAESHNSDVTLHIFPNDTHLFMQMPVDEPRTLKAETEGYVTIAQRIDPDVIRVMVSWLSQHA
ncbi:MAG TPA: alpha/beta fold hydrolase [Candidatus Tumulicola sp.]|jgi:hypothetical protein